MIIVYYGTFQRFEDCENWIAGALERDGHRCIRMEAKDWFNPDDISEVIRIAEADVLLLSKVIDADANALRLIRKKTGVKIVWWTFDWMRHPKNLAWYWPLAKEADLVFQTDGYGEPEYAAEGIERIELHQGLDPAWHDEVLPVAEEQAQFKASVAFCGMIYTPRRAELYNELHRYPGGRWWGTPNRRVWGRDFAVMCAATDVVVGDNFTNDVPGYWSDRVYLTLGCGGFFVTAYVEGLEKEFENHKHLVWWKNFVELHEIISYYLERPEERTKIAAAGYQLVHGRDTYDQRIQKFVGVLNDRGIY